MSKLATLCCAALLAGGVACGSGSRGGGSCTPSNARNVTGQDPIEIDIHSFAFQPSCFEARPGQRFEVVNQDPAPHTFTVAGTSVDVKVDGGGSLDGGSLDLAPGTYHFTCTIHPQMTGTLIVQ